MSQDPKTPLNLHQKLMLVVLLLTNVFEGASFSVIEPFFATEAKLKGVGAVTSGWIFAVYGLVQFIACPLWGKYLPKIGARNMYLAGVSTGAIGVQMFGVLIRLPNKNLFVVLTYVARILESVGHGAGDTALFTICAEVFPQRTAFITSLSETSVAVGYAVGPAIGGLLYEVGGYELPFLVLGGSVIICVVISILILPKEVKIHQECGSIWDVLSSWFSWPIICAILIDSTGFTFLEPTLSVHLQQFFLSPIFVGVFYLACSSIYAVVTPLVGYFIDETDMSRVAILIGLTLTGKGYLLIGPAPMLHLPNKLWIVFIGSCVVQLGWTFSLISPFQDLLLSAENHGFPPTIQLQGVISGIYCGAFSLGMFIGPSISGFMVDNLEFPGSCTVLSLVYFLVVILLVIFSVFELHYLKRYPKQFERQYQLLNDQH